MKMFSSVKGGGRSGGRRGGEAGREEATDRRECVARPPLAQDVQVDGGGFAQRVEYFIDLLDVEALLRLPLPAPKHDVVHLFGADSGPLQNAALGDALDDLEKRGERGHTALGLRPRKRPPGFGACEGRAGGSAACVCVLRGRPACGGGEAQDWPGRWRPLLCPARHFSGWAFLDS